MKLQFSIFVLAVIFIIGPIMYENASAQVGSGDSQFEGQESMRLEAVA